MQRQKEIEEEKKKEIAKYVKYMNYLETVLTILQSTTQFKEAMMNMTQQEMREGKIAYVVDHLEPHIVEQLTKAKMLELKRLEQEIKDQIQLDGHERNVKIPEHIDFNDWGKFGKEDLRKLILKTVFDMDNLEKQRKENFKEYEMKKKVEQDRQMEQMSEEERLHYLRQMEDARRRHNEHEPLKHPGSRDQLEDVWEDADRLDKDSYDPRTFFNLHDLDSDGYWSKEELDAIFLKELDKLYNASDPDDDVNERAEEMFRMREHVMDQMDKNKDHKVSLDEFLADTEAQNKQSDQGWEDINDATQYTPEELEEFKKDYAKQKGWENEMPAPPPLQHGQQAAVHTGEQLGARAIPGQAVPVQMTAKQPQQAPPLNDLPGQQQQHQQQQRQEHQQQQEQQQVADPPPQEQQIDRNIVMERTYGV